MLMYCYRLKAGTYVPKTWKLAMTTAAVNEAVAVQKADDPEGAWEAEMYPVELNDTDALSIGAQILRSVKTPARTTASIINGRRGGRPRKKPAE